MLEAVGAERAILSILLKKPDSLFTVDEILDENDFTNTGNQVIYTIIKELILEDPSTKLDSALIISHAESKGIKDFFRLTQNGDLLSAIHTTAKGINESSIGKHIAAVKKASIKRHLIETLDDLKDDVEVYSGSAMDLKNMVEDTVFNSMSDIDSCDEEIVNLSEDFEEVINSYADDDATLGLDIGFPRFQRDCGNLRNGTVTGIFARAKEGKSQIAAHSMKMIGIDTNELLGRLPVLYLDTEMQARNQQMRLCSMMTGISYNRIESGAWRSDPTELEKVKGAFKKIKNAPIYYKNIAGKSVNYVIPVIRKFIYKHIGGKTTGNTPRCLVIYDYIKLMNPSDLKMAQEYQILGFLLAALHDLASALNFPMLVLGQLNREALQRDSIGTIAGSDRITHNVDSLSLFRQKRPEEIELDGHQRGTHLMKVFITRNGPGHDFDEWINIHFDKSRGSFKEDKRNSEIQLAIRGANPAVRDRIEDQDTAEFGNIRQD